MTEKTENTTEAVNVEQPDAQTESAQSSSTELTVQDLTILRNIIDISTQRGAFKPNELVTVGQTYNKLDKFLESINKGQ